MTAKAAEVKIEDVCGNCGAAELRVVGYLAGGKLERLRCAVCGIIAVREEV